MEVPPIIKDLSGYTAAKRALDQEAHIQAEHGHPDPTQALPFDMGFKAGLEVYKNRALTIGAPVLVLLGYKKIEK